MNARTRRFALTGLAFLLAVVSSAQSLVQASAMPAIPAVVPHEGSNSSIPHALTRRLAGDERFCFPPEDKSSKNKMGATPKLPAAQTLQIDMRSASAFMTSISAARAKITSAMGKTSKGVDCYMTHDWTIQLNRPTVRVSFKMLDDVYIIVTTSHNYNSADAFVWSRLKLDGVLTQNKAFDKDVGVVYVVAEAIRFAWIENRIATILKASEDFEGFGFVVPRGTLLTNWGKLGKRLGIKEAETVSLVPKDVDWVDAPMKSDSESDGEGKKAAKGNATVKPSGPTTAPPATKTTGKTPVVTTATTKPATTKPATTKPATKK